MIEKHKRQLEDIANRNLVGIPPGAVRHLASEVSTIARILLELAPQLEWPIEPDGGPVPIPPPQEYEGPIDAGMVFQLESSNFEPTCLVHISSVDDWTVYMRVLSGKVRENGPGSTAFMGMNEFRRRAAYISRAPVRRPKLFAPPSTASSNSPKAKVSAPIPLASAVSAPEAAAADQADSRSRARTRNQLEIIAYPFVGHTFNTGELIDRILDTLMSHLHAKNELRAWLLLDRVKDGAE